MARILFAWELGAHLGHLGQLLPLARELRSRGHEVTFVIREMRGAEAALAGFRYTQAPLWRSRNTRPGRVPCSYAEIMQQRGFADREALSAMVGAWRRIFRRAAPDVVVFDHAPTALLAARGLEMVRVLYGVGFSSPPRVSPLPSFRTWEDVSTERLQSSEAVVLASINAVLARLGVERLAMLHELFEVDADYLCTFRELDHYALREAANYCGPVFHSHNAAPARWPADGGTHVFVYLRPEMPAFRRVAAALTALPYSVLWSVPGADPGELRPFETPLIKFVTRPVDLAQVGAEADSALLYASHGTVAAMLLAGVPMTLFPNHAEQMLVARNVVRLAAGNVVLPGTGVDDVRAAIEGVAENDSHRKHARIFAARYAGFDPLNTVRAIAERISACCTTVHA